MDEIVIKKINKNDNYVQVYIVSGSIILDEEYTYKYNPKIKIKFKNIENIDQGAYEIVQPNFEVQWLNKPTSWIRAKKK